MIMEPTNLNYYGTIKQRNACILFNFIPGVYDILNNNREKKGEEQNKVNIWCQLINMIFLKLDIFCCGSMSTFLVRVEQRIFKEA